MSEDTLSKLWIAETHRADKLAIRLTAETLRADKAEARVAEMEGRPPTNTVHLAWALKPGQPQIVAVCTNAAIAARYNEFVRQHYAGARFRIEEARLDHVFGLDDLQSTIYGAAARTLLENRDD